jgi:hypothetical protein
VADALQHGVHAFAAGELADALDGLLAALGDDVGGAREEAGSRLHSSFGLSFRKGRC